MVPALGTFIRLELEVSEPEFLRISSCVFDRIHELEKKLSFFKPESEIAYLNAAEVGEWVTVSTDTLIVLKIAQKLEQDSDGAFSAGNSLVFNENQVQKIRYEKIDLGGIAKGYCVDEAWREVISSASKLGINEIFGSINAGGDLYLHERAATSILISGSHHNQIPHVLRVGAVATSSVCPDAAMSANYPRAKTSLKKTVSVEASAACVADAMTKVVLFHPNPEPILSKWNAKLIYED